MDHIKTIVPTGTEAGFDLAKQTFDERFARDSHFGWKPLDYWSAGYDAALARRAAPLAHPIEQGSAVEPIGEVVRVSKSEGQVVIGLYGKSPKIGSLVYLSAPSSTDSAQAAVEEVQTQAARDVLAERRRQVEQEGWTSAHDDKYQKEELRAAALCYMRCKDITKPGVTPGAWPWSERWWKPTTDRRNLVKAAALIIADIERIDRSTAAQAATKGDKS
jgi:hypothetical protein